MTLRGKQSKRFFQGSTLVPFGSRIRVYGQLNPCDTHVLQVGRCLDQDNRRVASRHNRLFGGQIVTPGDQSCEVEVRL